MYKKYEELIYEYFYIGKKIKIFEKNNSNNIIRKECLEAIKRIFNLINISNMEDINNFFNLYKNKRYEEESEKLYKECLLGKKKNFFDKISEEELYLYHILNFDISYEYGINLSKHINFDNKKILDIGGSTGGLCKAIIDCNKNVDAFVFDTKKAFEISKEKFNNININYLEVDFFKKNNLEGNYDYIIFSNVIHDWDDKDVTIILNNFENIIKNSKYIIIHEDIILDNNIETLIYGLRLSANVFKGRQRTIYEIYDILKKSFKENIKLEKTIKFNILSAALFKLS